MRHLTCADCGAAFVQTTRGRNRHRCDDCRVKTTPTRPTACADCGTGITQPARGRRLRCDDCNLKKYGQGFRRSFMATKHQCLTCQRIFEKRTRGRVPLYCSGQCANWWHHFDGRAARSIALWNRMCKVCDQRIYERGSGNPTLGRRGQVGGGNALYCSKDCLSFDKGEKLIIKDRCRVPWRACEDCGAEFVGRWNRYRPLCAGCRAAGQRDTNRRKNYKRKSAHRPGVRYSLADIAERDGHRCHLCNRKVNMDLSGDHRRGPTIDHLIPLSDGGADVPENVALAHRSCNCARRDKGPAQLRLAA